MDEKMERPGTSPEEGLEETDTETRAGEMDPEEAEEERQEEGAAGEAQEVTEPQESSDEDEAVDAEYRSADEGKTSFFKKKKDKKDEKIEELTDTVKRQMAEFDNFRKRTEKEKSQMFDLGAKSVIEKILPVADNFERGLEAAGEDSEDPFAQGMQKIYKQLQQTLESLGVTPIEAVGQPFDPQFHNAVMHCEDENAGENEVVQELQKGYMYHDSVVRHSMVKVAN